MYDDNIADYIDSLERELPDHLRDMERKAVADGIPIIRKQAQALIRFLIKLHKPMAILEIGTAIGFSALFMGEYIREGCTVTTIEKASGLAEVAKVYFERYDKGNRIHVLEGDARDILEGLVRENRQYDFVFLDCAKGQYMNYLTCINLLLGVGGLLVTDNVLQGGTVAQSRYALSHRERTTHARMREFLYAVKHMDEYETVVLPVSDGMSVSYKVV